MARIVINTRVLAAPLTGTQRYTRELVTRWNGSVDDVAPRICRSGAAGHAWEQFILPRLAGKRFLFCPSNSGPLRSKNFAVTIHDMSIFDCRETFQRRFGAWYRFLLPRLALKASMIFTSSEFVKERILAHTRVAESNIHVIPLGVSSEFRPEAVAGLGAAVSALALPSRFYILVVGSVEHRKNLARLFQAWARVQDQLPRDLWLVVVGASSTSRVFAGVAFERLPDRVHLAGYIEERFLPSLFAGALFVSYLSYYEGFGLPVLEAMASGAPVLTGNRSSLPEVVGDAALTVDPFKVEAIADALIGLVQSSRARSDLRRKGLLRAKRYNWAETARKTWTLLQSRA